MADVKISALPAATTPLAGTEVLPIVQSGTTDQVSVANLTAGRTVNGAAFTASGTVSGATVTASGTVSGATVTASGTVSGATVSGTTVNAGAGSAAAPSISPTGDSNTGVFFPAADTIAFSEGGTEVLRLNSSGNAVFTNTVVMASSFLRNRIINGDMRIDQRNAGAAVTSNDAFPVDRFQLSFSNDGACSAQQTTTAPAGFINSLRFTTTTADATLGATQFAVVLQWIEGSNVADLGWGTASAQTVTLSFWVRSSLTGTFGGSVRNGDSSRGYPFTYTISAADTYEYKTITIQGDTTGTWATNNGRGLGIVFGLGVGSTFSGTAGAWAAATLLSATGAVSVIGTLNATWFVTGVQFEAGSAATPFERRQFGQELALCQRYYGTATSQIVAAATSPAKGIFFKTSMRTAVTIAGGGAGFSVINSTTEGFDCAQTTNANQTLTFSAEL